MREKERRLLAAPKGHATLRFVTEVEKTAREQGRAGK